MMLSALFFACLALSAQATRPISFRVTPRLAVETVHDEITFECKIPAARTDVYSGIAVTLKQTTSSGDGEPLKVIMFSDQLVKTGENRTEAEGNLKSSDDDDDSTFMTVKILEPVEEDSGTYECSIIYMDNNWNTQKFITSVTVNVTAVPPPNYIPQEEEEILNCECEDIRAEIDAIKATLASRGSGGAAAPAGECQVSFSAQFETRNSNPITDEQTLVFNSATTNKGNAYDATTGEFTAPCNGQYYFTVVLRSHQDLDAGYVDGVLMVGDVAAARTSAFIDTPISNMQQATTGSIVALTAGQKVKVVLKTTSSGQLIGNEYSVFSGFYVSP